MTLSLTNPVESIVKVTLLKCEESESVKEGDSQGSTSGKTETKGDKEDANEREIKDAENKDDEKEQKKHAADAKSESDEGKADKGLKEDEPARIPLRKANRRLDNTCASRAFVPTAEVSSCIYISLAECAHTMGSSLFVTLVGG